MTNPSRVLLIEDNHINQCVATAFLKLLGHKVDVAANGRVALQSMRERAYDAVLMDIQMPETNGLDATAAIRRSNGGRARIPIVAMTANALANDRAKCFTAGVDDFLAKPVSRAELAATLAKWIPTEKP